MMHSNNTLIHPANKTALLVVETLLSPKRLYILMGDDRGVEKRYLTREHYHSSYKNIQIVTRVPDDILHLIPIGSRL